MTYGEIFTKVLLEAGVRKELTAAILNHVKEFKPGNIDRELTDSEAEALLNQLRSEKKSIRAWLLKAGFLVMPPKGSA